MGGENNGRGRKKMEREVERNRVHGEGIDDMEDREKYRKDSNSHR